VPPPDELKLAPAVPPFADAPLVPPAPAVVLEELPPAFAV